MKLPAMKPLTPRQLQLLLWLRRWWADYDASPSLGDASKEFGVSNSAIDGHLQRLQMRGMVIQVLHPLTGRSRGWRLSAAGEILCSNHTGDVQPVRTQPIADETTKLNRLLIERQQALRRRYRKFKADRDARGFLAWLDEHVERLSP